MVEDRKRVTGYNNSHQKMRCQDIGRVKRKKDQRQGKKGKIMSGLAAKGDKVLNLH